MQHGTTQIQSNFYQKKQKIRLEALLESQRLVEGWLSETALFRKLEAEFSNTKVVQHGRPTWLGQAAL